MGNLYCVVKIIIREPVMRDACCVLREKLSYKSIFSKNGGKTSEVFVVQTSEVSAPPQNIEKTPTKCNTLLRLGEFKSWNSLKFVLSKSDYNILSRGENELQIAYLPLAPCSLPLAPCPLALLPLPRLPQLTSKIIISLCSRKNLPKIYPPLNCAVYSSIRDVLNDVSDLSAFEKQAGS